jgi:hypothetical protein
MPQNTTHAVMAQRVEAKDSRDDFPTPPWATRALFEHILDGRFAMTEQSCLEPACGEGHMARVLEEYFGEVSGSDIHDYPYAYGSGGRDFLTYRYALKSFDWVITNPPFRLSEEFIIRGMNVARQGVAILARSVFIESVGRYRALFESMPPTKFAQFTERVPMVKGRLDKNASTATSYAWLVWEKKEKAAPANPRLMWIPPCRKRLERAADYEQGRGLTTVPPTIDRKKRSLIPA